MNINIKYSKQSIKFIEKNNNLISRDKIKSMAVLSIRKIVNLEDVNINIKPLKGEWKGYHRIKISDIRIIFFISDLEEIIIFNVSRIDYRGNIYKN